jgi:mannosyl-3-phosphoglycerate phosphatase
MKRDDSPDRRKTPSKGRESLHGGSNTPFVIIFTDLDGTLLDHHTYEWEEARPALERCERLGVPVIMVSSKTRAEMERLRRELGFSAPYISENGGGVFFPEEGSFEPPPGTLSGDGLRRWSLGVPRESLVRALEEIKEELGWPIRGFHEMGPEEISDLTGLDLKHASLAAMRDYDEPFILDVAEGINESALFDSASSRGLLVSRGGRFYHLHGKSDKAEAVARLIAWYRKGHPQLVSLALGDSPNDFTMLRVATHPVLIRSARSYPGIEDEIPGLRTTRETGPRGWNEAVLEILAAYSG